MGIYEELQARGLIAQVTNEPEIREMVNTGKATFYIGFDPTADSLHVGHFMALCLMKRLQMAGNRPVVLVGGGTFRADNPCLTARIPGETVEQQPLACVLTSRLPNPAGDIHLLKERPHQAVFLCSPAAAASTAAHALRQMGVRVLALGPGQRGCPDFPAMFHMLYEDLHCPYVLCEGGGHLALSLLEAGFADEFLLHLAPRILGDNEAAPLFDGPLTMAEALDLRVCRTSLCDGDVHLQLRPAIPQE